MFGIKKNPTDESSQEVIMEMETMEDNLADKKPRRESIFLKESVSQPIKKKVVLPPEKKISQRPFASLKSPDTTVLSRKFLPDSEKVKDDFGNLITREQRSSLKRESQLETGGLRLEKPLTEEKTFSDDHFEIEKEKGHFLRKKQTPLEEVINKKNDFKNLLNKDSTETSSAYVKKTNGKLVAFVFIILFIAVSSGVYYYFFVLKKGVEETIATKEPSVVIAEPVQITEEAPEIIESLPSSLEEADPLEIKEQNLLKTISSLTTEEVGFEEGKIYEVLDNGKTINASSILSSLGINLPSSSATSFEKGWIFAKKMPEQNIRLGLILEIGKDAPLSQFKSDLLAGEKNLPTALDNIYIEDQIPLLDNQPINFSESLIDKDFRYFNFYPDRTYPSVDWGVKTIKTEDGFGIFLVLSTSMETTKTILENLIQ